MVGALTIGGVALPEVVLERPATTLLSGPAAGPGGGRNGVRRHPQLQGAAGGRQDL